MTGAIPGQGMAAWQIGEAFLLASVYCGVPRALNAVAVARSVLSECGLMPIA